MQEKRALEDHLHVTEMHNLILHTLQNQNEEMSDLKCVLETLAGKEVVRKNPAELPDIKSLHPRGKARFTEADVSRRMKEDLYNNVLMSTIRKGLSAHADEEQDIPHLPKSDHSPSHPTFLPHRQRKWQYLNLKLRYHP